LKKISLIMMIVFMLAGCGVKTVITDPEGKQWVVRSKSDARVIIMQDKTQNKTTLEVNNQGKTNWVEGLMQYILAKPDITLSNKEGR